MTDPLQRPVTADAIRASVEWPETYPGAKVVYEQDADEGPGAGFDIDRPPQPWDSWPFERGDGTLFDVLYRVDPAPPDDSKAADA